MKNKQLLTDIKNLINEKLADDMKYLHDKKFTIKNEEYREKLLSVKKHGEFMQQKKREAIKEMRDIKNRLALLNSEYLKETDQARLEEIEKKKKELRFKLEDLDDLVHTNISSVINGKYLKDLELPERESQREKIEFDGALEFCLSDFRELKNVIDGYMLQFINMKPGHIFNRNHELLEELKRDRFDDEDGWVSKKPVVHEGKTTIIYDGSSLDR